MTPRRPFYVAALLAALVLTAALLPAVGSGTSIAIRTARPYGNPNGPSANPVLTPSGKAIAFDSQATDLVADDPNGPIRDVFAIDRVTGVKRLVSIGLEGAGANAASVRPSISDDGTAVAFASLASNLVAGDTNGLADVFVRDGDGPIARVSVASDGTEANGPSSSPDISGDGRYVVFQSSASNLVPGDTNGQPDIFIRDLRTGTTSLVSVATGGGPANAASAVPSISDDGDVVSFFSSASNLTSNDKNGVADVFVRVRSADKTEIVSVSSTGHAQDHSIATGFNQVSDVSRDGRYVAFDSDASTLVHHDTNHRTDVFVRDRLKKITEIVSESNSGFEGNNDSYGPVISPDGRFVAFSSLASNLSADDAEGEDTFVRDRKLSATSLVDVGATGARKAPETTDHALQRPSFSAHAHEVAFGSTASNLVDGDTNSAEDIFIRVTTPPKGTAKLSKSRRTVTLSADDRAATRFLCRADRSPPFDCKTGTVKVPRRASNFEVRAGGPGMLYSEKLIVLKVSSDRKRPSVAIAPLTGPSLRTIRGTARDTGGSGLAQVQVAFVYAVRKGVCRHLGTKRKFVSAPCKKRIYVTATGRGHWHVTLPQSVKGIVAAFARARDRAGNTSRTQKRFAAIGRSRAKKQAA
jgi:Tol biopolymer transport system component